MTQEKLYRVYNERVKMPKETEGRYFIRRICHDGAVTFLPASFAPASEIKALEQAEQKNKA